MPQITRRRFRILPIAIVLCVCAGGFAIFNSVNLAQLAELAQEKVGVFAESDLGLRGNIGSPRTTGAAARIQDELTPETAAKYSPADTSVAPGAPASEQGTEREDIAPGLSARQFPETATNQEASPPENSPIVIEQLPTHLGVPAANEVISVGASATTPGVAPTRNPEQFPAGPATSTAPAPPLTEVRKPVPGAAALVTRGDAFVRMRDITSARLFYERAAEAGDGQAASRMGATFDPAFLERAGIPGAKPDEQQAVSWYRRARELGDAEADRLLKTLDQR
jgi:hypothetical protein